jgi:DNA-directed RNA polymerase subunit A'
LKPKLDKLNQLEHEKIVPLTQLLQIHVALYFDSKSVNQQQKYINRGNKKSKGLFQGLSHKDGLFRQNLMGKRTNFSARTVISPDPYLSINEVGVPEDIALNLTKPICVNRFNIGILEDLVKRGPYEIKGANAIVLENDQRIDLRFATLESVLPLRVFFLFKNSFFPPSTASY